MKNTLQDNDIIFRSDLLKTILNRAGSYIIGILTAYILPYLFQEGFSGVLDEITWDTIKQVSISIIIVLLGEAALRYLFYEISRLRANSDLREKAIILPKGVTLKDVVPFEVKDYIIKYQFSKNKKGGLDMTREESATVLEGNYDMMSFKFNILDSFPKFTNADIRNGKKTKITFATRNGSVELDTTKWKNENNIDKFVTYFKGLIGPNQGNKLIYDLKVVAKQYITQTDIDHELQEEVSEKVILEVKDITIMVEFQKGIEFSDLDFQAIGKSNVLLGVLASKIKENNHFDNSPVKSSFSIKIDSPVPDVRYGFKWRWVK
jgi:hypothetical protein